MKTCASCEKNNTDDAAYCMYCGHVLEKPLKVKWYFKRSVVIIVLLSVGPLACPLLWFSPRFSRMAKILITIAAVILTYFFTIWTSQAYTQLQTLLSQLKTS